MKIAPWAHPGHTFKVDLISHMSEKEAKNHTSHGFNSTLWKIETDLRQTVRGVFNPCCNLSIGAEFMRIAL